MTERQAAGPKTEKASIDTEIAGVTGRLQALIEDQVEALSRGVSACLENAGSDASRATDERLDAMRLVQSTAELLKAIAKLKGEFHHSYRVTRVSQNAEDRSQKPEEERAGEADAPAF